MTDATLEQNKRTIRSLYEDGVNRGDTAVVARVIADDFEGFPGDRGPQSFLRTVDTLRAGMPDVVFRVEDVIAEGDRVVVRWTWTGTHTGTFRGFAPTQRRLRDTGTVIYRLHDGKAVQAWLETDRLGVLQQIGAVPADLTKLANTSH